jgi:formate dehydrogenase assembly factor FdhD
MFPKYFVYCAPRADTVADTIEVGSSDEGGHYRIDCLEGVADPDRQLVYQAGCGVCFNNDWEAAMSVVCTRQECEGAPEQVVIDNVGTELAADIG